MTALVNKQFIVEESKYLPVTVKEKMSGDIVLSEIHGWFDKREASKKDIEKLSEVTATCSNAIPYFGFSGGHGTMNEVVIKGLSSLLFSEPDKAIKNLDASLWNLLLERTDIKDAMTSKKQAEWKSIIDKREMPEFTAENVIPTIMNTISQQGIFFAERLDTVFNALSKEHVTNTATGFGRRFILDKVISGYKGVYSVESHEKEGAINDLRVVVAILLGRAPLKLSKIPSSKLLSNLISEKRFGEWVEIDGNSLRIKIFKVGTVHVEVHPDIVYKLNDIVAMLYPKSIPSSIRVKSKKSPAKYFEDPIKPKMISMSTVEALGNIRAIRFSHREFRYLKKSACGHDKGYQSWNLPDCDMDEFNGVIEKIGGKFIDNDVFIFDGDAIPVLQKVIREGVFL